MPQTGKKKKKKRRKRGIVYTTDGKMIIVRIWISVSKITKLKLIQYKILHLMFYSIIVFTQILKAWPNRLVSILNYINWYFNVILSGSYN